MRAFVAVVKRDIQLAVRQSVDLVMVLAFFIIASALFPFGVGPDALILGRIASGVIWVLALLTVILSLDRMFHADFEDGTLEQMALGPQSFYGIIFAKILAHWIMTGLPLIFLAPVIGLMLHFNTEAYGALLTGLLLGTPGLSLMGAVGAGLSLGARRAGLLVAMLVLPLYIPILIFGVSAVDAALNNFSMRPHLLLMGAFLAAAIPLAPFAATAAVRQAME